MTEWITIPARKRGERISVGVTMAWRLTHAGRRAAFITIGRLAMERLGWPQKGRVEVAHDAAGTMLRAGLAPHGRALGGKGGFVVFSTALPWIAPEAPAQRSATVEFRIEDKALIVILPDWARKAIEYPKGRAIPLREPEPSKPKAPPMPRWTPERIAYIREHYTAGQALPIIVATLNTMPGEVVTEPQVRGYASSVMMLSRPVSKAQRREPTMLDAAPPSARDELEAKVLLRKGGKAREIADEFGLPLATVVRWADEVAAERERAA